MRSLALLLSCAAVLAAGCSKEPDPAPVAATPKPAVTAPVDRDEHSYAEPQKVAIDDLALDIAVDFDAKTIGGTATYTLDWKDKAATQLVLDADALNAVANDEALHSQLAHRQSRGWSTVLTPHPLEAARLLGCSTRQIMADRLLAAQTIADRFQVVCVLKGSGTVVTAPREIPRINPTGNAALSTAGTGDVLAGMIGAALAGSAMSPANVLDRVCSAVFQHGWLADHWTGPSLVAGELARRVSPVA